MILITHGVKLASKFGEFFLILEDEDVKASIFRDELLEQSRKEYPDRYEEDSSLLWISA